MLYSCPASLSDNSTCNKSSIFTVSEVSLSELEVQPCTIETIETVLFFDLGFLIVMFIFVDAL